VSKKIAHKRHAQHYLTCLDRHNKQYIRGGESIDDALAKYDHDSQQIIFGRERALAYAEEDAQAAEMVEDYAFAWILRCIGFG
jgi:hypothetical protein